MAGATLSAANARHGCRKNHPTMDDERSPLLSAAARPALNLVSGYEASRSSAPWEWQPT
jgi:hypothetical protein